jgi:hypothetical protein
VPFRPSFLAPFSFLPAFSVCLPFFGGGTSSSKSNVRSLLKTSLSAAEAQSSTSVSSSGTAQQRSTITSIVPRPVKSFGASSGIVSTNNVSPVGRTRQEVTSIEIIEAPFAPKEASFAIESLLFLTKSEIDFCPFDWSTLSWTHKVHTIAIALVNTVDEDHNGEPFADVAFGANANRELLWFRGDRKKCFHNTIAICSGDLLECCTFRPKYLTRDAAQGWHIEQFDQCTKAELASETTEANFTGTTLRDDPTTCLKFKLNKSSIR